MDNRQVYHSDTPAGYYHNPQTGMLHESNHQHSIDAYYGGLMAPPNDVTEWQTARQALGPQLANAPYGLDAVNPFIGIGHHPVKEM